jgi:class III poly(R)-hydroxyalkanoic acid synthase PhaE subunit
MNKLLSTPGVGPDREAQEQQRRYSKLWMDYQRTLDEYNSAHHAVGKETIERLKARVIELSEKGETLDSMRDVYDLWIDCAEDAYADFAYSDEYQEIYGRMINSQMALKKETRNTVDSMATSVGLPSSRSFDTVLKRMQEMRREIRQLKKSIQPSPAQKSKGTDNSKELKEMRAEINALRKEVAGLNKTNAEQPVTIKKKTIRKKAAASKTTK